MLLLSNSDPKISAGRCVAPAEDVYARIRNFDNLLRSIKSFYEVMAAFSLADRRVRR